MEKLMPMVKMMYSKIYGDQRAEIMVEIQADHAIGCIKAIEKLTGDDLEFDVVGLRA